MRSFEWYVRPEAGECAQTAVTLPHAEAAVIAGTVEDEQGPVEGALVLLTDQETERLLRFTVSDGLGRFWFGPLDGDRLYCLRAQKTDGQVRTVEL